MGLVNDGFSLVCRVGGPDGVRVNGAHAPHRGEQRFKREALSFSLVPHHRGVRARTPSAPAPRVALRRVVSRRVTSRRVATKDARVKIRSRRMAAAPNRSG